MKFVVLLIGLAPLLSQGTTFAQELPQQPILRIEAGMHTASIRRIGVDSENRYLVTGSYDKTVRVWELATGRLLQVLRPPVGQGNEGRIDAVAISPDGGTVACGGWTKAGENSHNIYLFDRATGSLVGRLAGLPNTIFHLVYSRDGRFLAATLGGKNGLRVYRVGAQYSLVAEDQDYGDYSYGADFDTAGRLVTACDDGFIRLYGSAGDAGRPLKLIGKAQAPGGKQPYSVSFSHDGQKIAVGFADSTKVDVLSGADLSFLYSPDTAGVDRPGLSSVTWSSPGSLDRDALYAGGRHAKGNVTLIRKWSAEGKGEYTVLAAATSSIWGLLPLKSGGVVFGAADPAVGVIDGKGAKVVEARPAIADYRDLLSGFLVSADGMTVQFGYEQFGRRAARFSLTDRVLLMNPGKASSMGPPVTEAAGLKIAGWEGSIEPKLNGTALPLVISERSRSLAISPDQKSFLLGTSVFLRLFNRSGAELWQAPAPGEAWSVNISGNNKLAVAAFGDGTIRWYRMSDGKELLAFFPHNDKRRWIVWASSGYYDAAPGAEQLIGWHLNRGKDRAADFFPASKFRATSYRPDLVSKILETLDEAQAVRLANEGTARPRQAINVRETLPPVVQILSPADGAEVSSAGITLRFSVRSPSGEPITAIKALIDGRPVAAERGLKIVNKEEGAGAARDADVREINVLIPERDLEISIIAENRYAPSESATVRIKWRGNAPAGEFTIRPKLYVLAVGVSKYQSKDVPQLGLANKDARDFAAVVTNQKGGLYREVVVKLLTDEQATRDEVLDGLDWIRKETTSKDVAMVFLAGHGVNDQNGLYYFLPFNTEVEKLLRTGVPFSDIKNAVASIAGKALFFVDTCHSGNVMGTRRGGVDITGVVNELGSAENGAVVFAASTGRQFSLENADWGNGAFTKALVEGIGGKADYTGAGRITINMLDLYISERVKELTKGQQTPTTTKPQTVPDFPVAVKR
jgi:WD40 repeat protein